VSASSGERGTLVALQAATHHVLEHMSRELAALGLTPGEINLLAQFGEEHALPVARLVRGTRQRPSTVTGIIDRLERRGLCEREINPRDRRSFIVSLTDPGASAAAAVARTFEAIEQQLDAATTKRDRAGFRSVARAIERLPQPQPSKR
jgi:MarR family transcriptional regulator, organic hydroperoxide resistance regulator